MEEKKRIIAGDPQSTWVLMVPMPLAFIRRSISASSAFPIPLPWASGSMPTTSRTATASGAPNSPSWILAIAYPASFPSRTAAQAMKPSGDSAAAANRFSRKPFLE